MSYKIILLGMSLFYFAYLPGPFWKDPLGRNYLKLYKNRRYLRVNVIISIVLAISNLPFTSLPLMFILTVLLANKICWHYHGRDFVLIQRGDWVKGTPIDYMLSVGSLFLSLALTFAVSYIFAQIPMKP